MRKVICTDNEGLELEFNIGDKYDIDREFDTTYIVTNKLGKKHTVFKTQFKPEEESDEVI